MIFKEIIRPTSLPSTVLATTVKAKKQKHQKGLKSVDDTKPHRGKQKPLKQQNKAAEKLKTKPSHSRSNKTEALPPADHTSHPVAMVDPSNNDHNGEDNQLVSHEEKLQKKLVPVSPRIKESFGNVLMRVCMYVPCLLCVNIVYFIKIK